LETKSIDRLLSLLELGGQTALVRIHPLVEPSATGPLSGSPGWSQGGPPSMSPAAPWYADLYVQAGQLNYCAVFNATGERRLVGEQALNFLSQRGGLSYELLPLPPLSDWPSPKLEVPAPAPQPPAYQGHPSSLEQPAPLQSGGAASFPVRPISSLASWRPARTRWGELIAQSPQRLTRDQRRILALINGQRSVDELSRLLGVYPEALSDILAFLREQNLIS
jgi:hypothetical protein